MPSITINGRQVNVPEDQTILQATRGIGIKIPTLCHHDALPSHGSCRLCVVEINKRGKSRVVTSCNYPVEEGLEIFTHSRKIMGHRRMLMELLLARCPDVESIRAMGRRMGVETTRFPLSKSDCVLCGLCVRVCEERIGVSAISFVNRGVEEDVAAPFNISSETCIGCGACASVCPTGCIKVEQVEGLMKIKRFQTTKNLHQCPSCKEYYTTERQLTWIEHRLGPNIIPMPLCNTCKRSRTARMVAEISATSGTGPKQTTL